MYLRSAHIEQVKGLNAVRLGFAAGEEPGWHVILGDNGAGKTTLIRALALGFVGPTQAAALREDWSRWLHRDADAARITLKLGADPAWDSPAGRGRGPVSREPSVKLELVQVAAPSGDPDAPRQAQLRGGPAQASRLVWGTGRGWFSASFGPTRRLTGGSGDYQRIFFSNPQAARHLSAFSEEVALSEALAWLVDAQRAGRAPQVERVRAFINGAALLPHGVTLAEVTDQSLRFEDGNGVSIDARALSDGYRSVLSLTLELLRQMEVAYGLDAAFNPDNAVVVAPGVVLIDEIDAHLHPSWQESVGAWFTARFPRVQFLVATHSALVCRSIGASGKVFRLRAPGEEGPQLREIAGEARDMLWFGSLERALSSEGFGLELGLSSTGWERVEELRVLTQRQRDEGLSPADRARLRHLRAVLADAQAVPR
jgi:energy-coupling factor transporter ATP-binding protein EcfA2